MELDQPKATEEFGPVRIPRSKTMWNRVPWPYRDQLPQSGGPPSPPLDQLLVGEKDRALSESLDLTRSAAGKLK